MVQLTGKARRELIREAHRLALEELQRFMPQVVDSVNKTTISYVCHKSGLNELLAAVTESMKSNLKGLAQAVHMILGICESGCSVQMFPYMYITMCDAKWQQWTAT